MVGQYNSSTVVQFQVYTSVIVYLGSEQPMDNAETTRPITEGRETVQEEGNSQT